MATDRIGTVIIVTTGTDSQTGTALARRARAPRFAMLWSIAMGTTLYVLGDEAAVACAVRLYQPVALVLLHYPDEVPFRRGQTSRIDCTVCS